MTAGTSPESWYLSRQNFVRQFEGVWHYVELIFPIKEKDGFVLEIRRTVDPMLYIKKTFNTHEEALDFLNQWEPRKKENHERIPDSPGS